jgi:hypothetical protein
MQVIWDGCKSSKDLEKIPQDIIYGLEHDWLIEDSGSIIFHSLDDAYRAIKAIYPLATYTLEVNNSYATIFIENFDNHLYELKEYRK